MAKKVKQEEIEAAMQEQEEINKDVEMDELAWYLKDEKGNLHEFKDDPVFQAAMEAARETEEQMNSIMENLDYAQQTVENQYGRNSVEYEAATDVKETFEGHLDDLAEDLNEGLSDLGDINKTMEELLMEQNKLLMEQNKLLTEKLNNTLSHKTARAIDTLKEKALNTINLVKNTVSKMKGHTVEFIENCKDNVLKAADIAELKVNQTMKEHHQEMVQEYQKSIDKYKAIDLVNQRVGFGIESVKLGFKNIGRAFAGKEPISPDTINKNIVASNKLNEFCNGKLAKWQGKLAERESKIAEIDEITQGIENYWQEKGKPIKNIDDIIKKATKEAELDNQNLEKTGPSKNDFEH